MESNMISPMEFGELKAEVAAQRRDLDKIITSIDSLTNQVQSIKETLTEAKGGWRMLMMFGSAGAALGGVVSYVMQHVRIIP